MNPAMPLSPAESYVLLDTKKASGREAFKVTILSLLAQGAIVIKTEARKGIFGSIKTSRVCAARPLEGELPGHVEAAMSLVRPGGSDGVEMKALATAAQKFFGNSLDKYKTGFVVQALLQRGLVREEHEKVMFVFNRTVWPLTTPGTMEKNRLEGLIARARTLPGLLGTDKAEAAAIVLAAGGVLLLILELKPFYGQMAALRPRPGTDDYSGDSGWQFANTGNGFGGVPDAAASDGFDFSGFDSSAFDSLDSSLASFDSSFDSSFSDSGGGDSGGDSGGGGDGGGGGD